MNARDGKFLTVYENDLLENLLQLLPPLRKKGTTGRRSAGMMDDIAKFVLILDEQDIPMRIGTIEMIRAEAENMSLDLEGYPPSDERSIIDLPAVITSDDFELVTPLSNIDALYSLEKKASDRFVILVDEGGNPSRAATVRQILQTLQQKETRRALLASGRKRVDEVFAGVMKTDFALAPVDDSRARREAFAKLGSQVSYMIMHEQDGTPVFIGMQSHGRGRGSRGGSSFPEAVWIDADAPDLMAGSLKEKTRQNPAQVLVIVREKQVIGLVELKALERVPPLLFSHIAAGLPPVTCLDETTSILDVIRLVAERQIDTPPSPLIIRHKGRILGLIEREQQARLVESFKYRQVICDDKLLPEAWLVDESVGTGDLKAMTESILMARQSGVSSIRTLDTRVKTAGQVFVVMREGEIVDVKEFRPDRLSPVSKASAIFRCRRHPRCTFKKTVSSIGTPPFCGKSRAHGRMVLVRVKRK